MHEGEASLENYINPEGLEMNPEAVMEREAGERYELFRDVFVSYGSGEGSKLLKKLPELVYGLGDVVMLYKAVTGWEGDEKLSVGRRFVYGAAVATEIVAVLLAYEHQYLAAGGTKVISEVFAKGQFFYTALESLSEKNPQLARIMEAGQQLIASQKENLPALGEMVKKILNRFNPEAASSDEQI